MKIKQALALTLGVAAAGAGIFASNETASAATRVTVKQGDSVWALAKNYHTSVKAIEQANHLTNSSLIFAGQSLNIPAKSTTTASVSRHTSLTHTAPTVKATKTEHHVSATPTKTTTTSSAEEQAKAWIVYRESRGSYTVTNGQYIGKYQLSSAYLNGDYSAANQDKVANQYVADRYGSWVKAQAFWQAHGWY